jgi:hypothetical protein
MMEMRSRTKMLCLRILPRSSRALRSALLSLPPRFSGVVLAFLSSLNRFNGLPRVG